MNRCNAFFVAPLYRRKFLAFALALPVLGMSHGASAQSNVRPFPPQAERATMVVIQPPIIQMNGKPDRLSPGSRIRAANGMVVLSGSIIGQSLVVNYVREPMGSVHEVWILTPEEAALKLPTQH